MGRKIKAIETMYAGRFLRSRLEARWAVFFDALGITWEYEMRSMEIGGEWYIPDFELMGGKILVEIKPNGIGRRELDRVARIQDIFLKKKSCTPDMWLVQGSPAYDDYRITVPGMTTPAVFADCRHCDGFGLTCINGDWWGDVGNHDCKHNDKRPVPEGDRVLRAYRLAMSRRFEEHKQTDDTRESRGAAA